MKECCIVHIGMNKTGSSSIQEALGTKMTDTSFSYISLPSHNHSGRIVSLFMESPETYHAHVKRGLTSKQVDEFNKVTEQQLIQNFRQSTASTQIISGEGISKLSEFELVKFKDFLDPYFKKVMIVAYYRLPYAFMESAFQQRVKGGLNRFNIKNLYPDYRNLFEKFYNIFGISNVHLWKFDPVLFTHNDVVQDFCSRLNINMNYKNIKKENEALSIEALSLLYCYHKFGEGYGIGPKVIKENDLLVAALMNIGSRKLKFSKKLLEPILLKQNEDIHWMLERVGQSMQEEKVCTGNEITEESELIHIAMESQGLLSDIMSSLHITKRFDENSPEMIAELIHILRLELSKRYYSKQPILNKETNGSR